MILSVLESARMSPFQSFARSLSRNCTCIVGLALATGLWQLGCTASKDRWTKARPEVYPTSGIVTLKGEPLEGAMVVFLSPDGKHSAHGRTDDDGKFVLMTFRERDGAVAGTHQVTVTKTEYIEKRTAYDTPGEPSVARIPKQLLPAKLSKPETSGLSAEVTPQGPNFVELELADE